MTNLRSLPDLFRAAGKLAAVCFFSTALTASASAQTNTFPTSGNAGVGTTTPTLQSGTTNTMIEVKGTVNPGVGLTSTAAGGRQFFLYSSQVNPGYFSVFDATAGADRFVIGSSGNVGIGTSSPNARLVLASGNFGLGTNSLATWTHATSVIESLDSSIFFGLDTDIGLNSNAYHNGGWKYKTSDLAANVHLYKGDIYFRTAATGTADTPLTWTNSMFIKSNGNVGIGTTNPLSQLHFGTLPNAGLKTYTSSETNHGFLLSSYMDTNSPYRRYGDIVAMSNQDGISGGSTIRFLNNPHNSFTALERMRIDYLGNVGIGTTSPTSRLHVGGQADNLLHIASTGSAASDTVANFTSGAGNILIVRGNGNVGIGTTTPGYRLDVAGEIRSSSGGFRFPDGSVQTTAATGGGGSQWVGSTNIYYNGGNVGIGTNTPGAKLDVVAGDSSFALFGPNTTWGGSLAVGSGAAFVSPISGRAQVLSSNGNLHLDGGTGQNVYLSWLTPSNTIINGQGGNVAIGNTSPSEKLHVTGNGKFTGNLTVDGNINAKYQDVAEWVPSSEQLVAGTVVVLDTTKSNQVVSATEAYDTRVAGVISAQPGITLGESGEGKVLVATTGRVRVKVDASRGAIQIGDLLVTSDVPGVAMKSEPVEFAGRKMHMPGTIIGKALEPLAKGRGEILVLLSLQ